MLGLFHLSHIIDIVSFTLKIAPFKKRKDIFLTEAFDVLFEHDIHCVIKANKTTKFNMRIQMSSCKV